MDSAVRFADLKYRTTQAREPLSRNVRSRVKLHNPGSTLFVPDGTPLPRAVERVTHMGIGAHQDDLEIATCHGIIDCFGKNSAWFGGVTCTNGAGSARSGPYSGWSDDRMRKQRRLEQEKAAQVGEYGFVAQLDYESASVKSPGFLPLMQDLILLLRSARPSVVYTHNPADKHDTHVGVFVAVIEAVRALPREERPRKVLGCEAWRDLDWLPDEDKELLDLGEHENLAAALTGLFDSQIAGGKRYDLATLGRRRAHATFFQSHEVDEASQLSFGMDLTPLIRDDDLDIIGFTESFIDRFRSEVRSRLAKRLGCGEGESGC